MAVDWKKCKACGGEFLKVVDGKCAGCWGWAPKPKEGQSRALAARSGAVRQDRKTLAAGDEDIGEDAEIL